jgi:hypothetical protein
LHIGFTIRGCCILQIADYYVMLCKNGDLVMQNENDYLRWRIEKERKSWSKDYIDAIIKNNLRDLVAVLAAWSGKFIDLSLICVRVGLSHPTLISYINYWNHYTCLSESHRG